MNVPLSVKQRALVERFTACTTWGEALALARRVDLEVPGLPYVLEGGGRPGEVAVVIGEAEAEPEGTRARPVAVVPDACFQSGRAVGTPGGMGGHFAGIRARE